MAVYTPLDERTARRAYLGLSFDPEKRGAHEIKEHKEIFECLTDELGEFFSQSHADKLRDLWHDYLHSQSQVMSPMITGPANFPAERNRKKSEAATNKSQAIHNYCAKLRAWKAKEDRKKEIEAAGGELAMKKAELDKAKARHEAMKKTNNIIRKAFKTGGIKPETKSAVIAAGISPPEAEQVTNPPSNLLHYGYGFAEFELRNSNARLKTLAAKVAELEHREEAKKDGKKPESVEIPNGRIYVDTVENRINVEHDSKPEREIIAIIKEHGFKWSPSRSIWTRKLTTNASYRTKDLIKALNEKAAEAAK